MNPTYSAGIIGPCPSAYMGIKSVSLSGISGMLPKAKAPRLMTTAKVERARSMLRSFMRPKYQMPLAQTIGITLIES